MAIFIILMVVFVAFLIIGTVQVTPEMIANEKQTMADIKVAKANKVDVDAVKLDAQLTLKAEKAKKELDPVKAEAKAKKEQEKQEAAVKKLLAKKVRSIKGKTPSEKIATLDDMLKAGEITEDEYKDLKNLLIMEI